MTVLGQRSHGGGNQIDITEAGLDQIRRDRRNGLTLESIARRLGTTRAALARLRQRDPRIDEALAVGHSAAEEELVDIITRKARTAESDRDSLIAAMFLLKSRHGYRDTGPLDGAAGATNIQINNYDRMTTEEIRQRVAQLVAERERLLNGDQETQQAQDAEIVDADE